jgi:hypothetical protein
VPFDRGTYDSYERIFTFFTVDLVLTIKSEVFILFLYKVSFLSWGSVMFSITLSSLQDSYNRY